MELQLFLHNDLALHFYYSRDSKNKETIKVKNLNVYFNGLPNFASKEFFESRVDKDSAFLVVYYYGTWLSGRQFTPKSLVETVNDAVEFACQKQGIRTFDNQMVSWEYEAVNVIGFSFAGNPILSAKLDKVQVKNVLLYAPLIYLHKSQLNMVNIDASSFYNYNKVFLGFLRRGYKNVLEGIEDESWTLYFNGEDEATKVDPSENFPPISIWHGSEDQQVDVKMSQYLQSVRPNAKLTVISGVGHTKDILSLEHLQ